MRSRPVCLRCLEHPGWDSSDPHRRGIRDHCGSCLGSGVDQDCPPVPNEFWAQIDHQLLRIMTNRPTSFDQVRAVLLDECYDSVLADVNLNGARSFDDDTAFFAGSGGEKTLNEALRYAGWYGIGWRAPYFYAMSHDSGDILTYIEGDVLRGDRMPKPLADG